MDRHLSHLSTLAAVALAAIGLGGCVSVSTPREEPREDLVISSPMRSEQLATCVAHVFDSQIPLVRRRSWQGGAEIVVRDTRDQPMVVVTIAAVPEGSTLRLVSNRSDRRTYVRLIGNCVRLPEAASFG
jgi:hypothetical protein